MSIESPLTVGQKAPAFTLPDQTGQKTALRDFDPQQLVQGHLKVLGEREIQILTSRQGLNDGREQTLEHIGKRLNLTRERVRQIEKDSFKKLKKNPFSEGLKGD